MNRADFLKMMENPSSIDSAMTSDIGEIVAIFPYFQTAHLLLLKGLHLTSDIRFSNQLRNSAVHIADREILYQFLYSQPAADSSAGEQPSDLQQAHEPEIETARQIVVNRETGQTEAEEKAADVNEERGPEVSGQNVTAEDSVPDIDTDATDPVSSSHEEQVEAEIVIDEVPEAVPGNDESLLELDTDLKEASGGTHEDNSVEPAPPDPVKLSQSDLIDRFIIANPRIEPNREKKEVPVEDRSVPIYGEGVFVTETLARIYISQGYYSKAIDIFEKLSLKYPEKSSYFATQIEKVKEYLKK